LFLRLAAVLWLVIFLIMIAAKRKDQEGEEKDTCAVKPVSRFHCDFS